MKTNTRGLPASGRSSTQARGLQVRGVVAAVYVYDDDLIWADGARVQSVAVYADVAVYSRLVGGRIGMLSRALVQQTRSGLHDGDIWIPRPAKLDLSTGLPVDWHNPNFASLDGDHVIVSFLDDDLATPLVQGSIPHPLADIGVAPDAVLGRRLRLRKADGDPRLIRHHGSMFGVTDAGDFLIDLRAACSGAVDTTGREVSSAVGASGHVTVLLPRATGVTIQAEDAQGALQDILQLSGGAADARAVLGTGDASAVVGEALMQKLAAFDAALAAWSALLTSASFTPTGAPGPAPTAPSIGVTGTELSTKVKFPTG